MRRAYGGIRWEIRYRKHEADCFCRAQLWWSGAAVDNGRMGLLAELTGTTPGELRTLAWRLGARLRRVERL
jgi:hypothetical protein